MIDKKEKKHHVFTPGLAHSPQACAIIDILIHGSKKEKDELFRQWRKWGEKKGKERWGNK